MSCPNNNCVKRQLSSSTLGKQCSSSDSANFSSFSTYTAGTPDSKGDHSSDLEWDGYCHSPVEDFFQDDVTSIWNSIGQKRRSHQEIIAESLEEAEHILKELRQSCSHRCTYGCVHTLFTRAEKLNSFLVRTKKTLSGIPEQIGEKITKIEYDLEELTKEFDLWRLRSKHRRKQVEQGVSQHLATKHNDVISNINAVEFPKDASLTWDSLELLSQKHLDNVQDLTEACFSTKGTMRRQEERDSNSTSLHNSLTSTETAISTLKNYQAILEESLLDQFWLLNEIKENGFSHCLNWTECLLNQFNYVPEYIVLEVSEIQSRQNGAEPTDIFQPSSKTTPTFSHNPAHLPSHVCVSIEVSVQNIQSSFLILQQLEFEIMTPRDEISEETVLEKGATGHTKGEKSFCSSVCHTFLVLLVASFLYFIFYICLYVLYLHCQPCLHVEPVAGAVITF